MSDPISHVKSIGGSVNAEFTDALAYNAAAAVGNVAMRNLSNQCCFGQTSDGVEFRRSKYLSNTGIEIEHPTSICTGYVAVLPGETVHVKAKSYYNSPAYLFYDGSKNIVSYYPENNSEENVETDLVIPDGVYYMRASAFAIKNVSDIDITIGKQKQTMLDQVVSMLSGLIDNGHGYTVLDSVNVTMDKGYINYDGYFVEEKGYFASDFIDLRTSGPLSFHSISQYFTVHYALYDERKCKVATLPANKQSIKDEVTSVLDPLVVMQEYPRACYVRFCTQGDASVLNLRRAVLNVGEDNVLRRKKYVAIGDSFTHGDWSGWEDDKGNSGTDSPEIYDASLKVYKTYPYWIAKRNSMSLVNMAVNGSTITSDGGTQAKFSYNLYQKIPTDADYITIRYGLNDTSRKCHIGTIWDDQNTTFYGAWNVVLSWILDNVPGARVGIVNESAYLGTEYREAVNAVGKKFGIPVLDLYNDPGVPMIMGHAGANTAISQKVSKRYVVSSSNGHPNLEAHKKYSTIIENFMRTL